MSNNINSEGNGSIGTSVGMKFVEDFVKECEKMSLMLETHYEAYVFVNDLSVSCSGMLLNIVCLRLSARVRNIYFLVTFFS